MSSNPVLDDDDILLIPAAEEAAVKDTPTFSNSISRGSVYPYWTEDPNRLPIALAPQPVTLSIPTPTQELEMRRSGQPARHTVIQLSGGQRGGLSPVSADPPLSFTGAYVASCVVYWCFCLVLGGIAYVIATIGENHAYEGNIVSAKTYRKASIITSVIGIVLGIIVLVIIFAGVLPIYGLKRT